MAPIILTIGHSTRPVSDFTDLLLSHQVQRLVDIRTIPCSRHNPQFGQDALADSLRSAGIHYQHMPGLGGLRKARPNSINTGWRNASFRGYADYMQTAEFHQNLSKLIELAKAERVAIMCAEAVPWRCHRSLVADALVAHAIEVQEITSPTRSQTHKLTPWAKVKGTEVTYPPEQMELTENSERVGCRD